MKEAKQISYINWFFLIFIGVLALVVALVGLWLLIS
jgi:Co/Zn/Cd efflux system component